MIFLWTKSHSLSVARVEAFERLVMHFKEVFLKEKKECFLLKKVKHRRLASVARKRNLGNITRHSKCVGEVLRTLEKAFKMCKGNNNFSNFDFPTKSIGRGR
jgi:hypothetical protein